MAIGAIAELPARPVSLPTEAVSQQSSPAAREQDISSPKLYLSPIINLDQSGLFLLQFRDAQSGEVRAQIPPERVVREYQEHVLESEPRVAGQPAKAKAEDDGESEEADAPAPQDEEAATPPGRKVSVEA